MKGKRMKGPTVLVGRHQVPIRQSEFPTMIWVAAGQRGQHERGVYAIWTAVLKRGFSVGTERRLRRVLTGRCRVWMSPGDRFDRMRLELRTAETKDERDAYRFMWNTALKRGANIKYIRPAIKGEVYGWAHTHMEDWEHLTRMELNA